MKTLIVKCMFILSSLREYSSTEMSAIAMILMSGKRFLPHVFKEAVRIAAKENHPVLLDGTVCTKIYPGDEDWVEIEYCELLERATLDEKFDQKLAKLFFRDIIREILNAGRQ
jgi:hypothetical protein